MKGRWLLAWLIQVGEMLVFSALASLCLGVHGALYDVMLWAGVPLAGLFTAMRAVRRGLLNYAAWIAPPLCLLAAHQLIWQYAPHAGAALLTAFAALVGAAAGEVMKLRKRKKPGK